MSDTALNKIIQYGTEAERLAFTPDPASGSQILYLWYQTDENTEPIGLYAWISSAWVLVNPEAPPWYTKRTYTAIFLGDTSNVFGDITGWTMAGGAFDYSGAAGMVRGMNQPTTNAQATIRTTAFNYVQSRYNPSMTAYVKYGGAISDRRLFFGFCASNEAFASDEPNATYVGIRLIPGVDTNWTAVACNGTGANTSTADTGHAPSIGELMKVDIWTEDNGATWNFSINDSTPVTINTDVPTTTTYMGILYQNRTTGGGVDKLIGLSRIAIEMEP